MSVLAERSVARAHFRVANSKPWRRGVRNSAVAAAETRQSDQHSGPAACGIVRRKAKLERVCYGSVGLGPDSLFSAVASLAFAAKVFTNMTANSRAFRSSEALSFQLFRGFIISSGTPGHDIGTATPNTGSGFVATSLSAPERTALTMARVNPSLILCLQRRVIRGVALPRRGITTTMHVYHRW